MTYKAICTSCGAKVPRFRLLAQPCRCPGCGTTLVRTGTIVLTAPSLVIMAGTIWIGALRLVPPWVLLVLWLINFETVIFLLPYFARLESLRAKPNDMQ